MGIHQNRLIRPIIAFFLRLALTAPGRWFLSNFSARIDPILFRWSRGLLNSTGLAAVFPVLVLTTTGRRSGKKRSVQLAYVGLGGDAYVVASNFGKERHPAWMHNIEADARVSVQLGARHHEVVAERLSEEQKAAIWPKLVEQLSNYHDYQERSGRALRVYRLPLPGVEDTV